MIIINKINEIIGLEKDIADLYSHLYELELLGDKEYKVYTKYHDELENKLKEEENLFDSLSIEEIREIYDYFRSTFEKRRENKEIYKYPSKMFTTFINFDSNKFGVLISSGISGDITKNKEEIIINKISDSIKNQYTIYSICDRLAQHIYNKSLNDTNINDNDDEILMNIKERELIYKIIIKEYNNAYLTFLNEYIESVSNKELKKELLRDKYDFAYIHRIKLNDREVIGLELDTFNINKYFFEKNMFGLREAEECIDYLISKCSLYITNYVGDLEKTQLINTFLKVRGYCLLIDDNIYNDFVSEYFSSDELCSILNDVLGFDVIDTLKKDRERNKTLSLKK